MNTISISSSLGGRTLVLSNCTSDYFDIAITGDNVSASRTVYSYLYADAFVEFFNEIATQWKGWHGEKSWESLEGELKIKATSDKLGHVTLFIHLNNRTSEDSWIVEAPIFLDSGNLDQVSKKVRSFFSASKIQAQQGAAANP